MLVSAWQLARSTLGYRPKGSTRRSSLRISSHSVVLVFAELAYAG